VSTYRDWTIVGFPPPSSGGVHVAQMLNLLAGMPADDLKPGPAGFVHRVVETMKLAFADRAHWLGDPAFVDVPTGLVSMAYARQLAARIDPERATPVARHGEPPDWQQVHFDKHTTHFAAADEEGRSGMARPTTTTTGTSWSSTGGRKCRAASLPRRAMRPGLPGSRRPPA
jgi:gamma-glutamyltranspeptidase/glutathione hydrolase